LTVDKAPAAPFDKRDPWLGAGYQLVADLVNCLANCQL
jgi:hypothetical protein